VRGTRAGAMVAALIGIGAAVNAQTTETASQPSPDASREVTVTGCLVRSADGRFALMTTAQAEPMARNVPTGTSGRSASSTEPAGSGTTRSAAGMIAWPLSASSGNTDLEKHVGHRLQVTGKTAAEGSDQPEPPSSATAPTTTADATTTTDTKGPELEVQSIKLVASSCS
jgi:hypothetical protein